MLSSAVSFGHEELAAALVDLQACVNVDCEGQRALHYGDYAAAYNSEDVVTIMLEQPGLDVSARDHGGKIALQAAAQNNNQVSVVILLLKHPGTGHMSLQDYSCSPGLMSMQRTEEERLHCTT